MALDYEAKANYAVTVSVSDDNHPDAPPVTTTYSLTVSDVNEAPIALAFTIITSTLPETRSTANRVRVADIAITDDALGANDGSLSGADAASFEVEGTALFLKAGTRLSHVEGSQRREATLRQLDLLARQVPVLVPEGAEICRHYAVQATALKLLGTPTGANDLWIACHALALDATLVSHNVSEFARI